MLNDFLRFGKHFIFTFFSGLRSLMLFLRSVEDTLQFWGLQHRQGAQITNGTTSFQLLQSALGIFQASQVPSS